ncbi:hypothetical protein MLD38_039388 [Melastoma candidum]|uniref:Uncharacterized protein n=1 Tax=Melastoma candidum TaxID=119954 RepID=A0ACB9L2N6_9MYRT|nr:hypothetical protein MLD38_039388 [Melastoma candidum]
MHSPKKNLIKGKRKLTHFLGFSNISLVSNSAIPEVEKQILEKIVSKQSSDESCVTHSSSVTDDVSDNSGNDGLPSLTRGASIAPQNNAADDIPDLNEESELESFRRAATMLFFEGNCNCRHVVPVGSGFQAEIPPLQSEYAENKHPRDDEDRLCRVNKVKKFPNGRPKLYRQGRMI